MPGFFVLFCPHCCLPGIKAITYRNNLEIYVIFSDTNKQSTIISTLLWITVNLSINHVTWMTAF